MNDAIAGVSLTAAAADQVRRQLERRGHGAGLRVGVKEAGCSGFAYRVDFADEVGPQDLVFQSHGVQVIVAKDQLAVLTGVEVDFVRQGLNESFKFRNPNAKDECGCGESFTV